MFIVMFDDEGGMCYPMSFDPDCEGALCGLGDSVALFADRKKARQAIEISKRFAALRKSQGKIYNSDFIECIKFLKVMRAEQAKGGA